MALPTLTELTSDLGVYVDSTSADNAFVTICCAQAVTYIGHKIDRTIVSEDAADYITAKITEKMPLSQYQREVQELGADLFYRRQAKNGVVSVNALEGTIARVARDPYAACDERMARFLGLGAA